VNGCGILHITYFMSGGYGRYSYLQLKGGGRRISFLGRQRVKALTNPAGWTMIFVIVFWEEYVRSD
jgi:hypothetical protein